MTDVPHTQSVKLYCAKCEDLYNPKSSRHAQIDGAYFGTSFQNILFQVYPNLVPEKSTERYEPKIYGFKVHAAAALMRWQEDRRKELLGNLKEQGVESPFKEDVAAAMDDNPMDDDEDAEEEGNVAEDMIE